MFLASCGYDIKVHSCINYKQMYAYQPLERTGPVQTLSWCYDGSLLSFISCNGLPEILHIKNKKLDICDKIVSIYSPTTAIFQRSTGNNLAVATYSDGIYIYDTESHSTEKIIDTNGGYASIVEWNVTDSHLAAGETNGQISIYDMSSYQKVTSVFIPASKTVSALRYHPTMSHNLCCSSDEGPVVLWDTNVRQTLFYTDVHKAPVTGLAFSSLTNNLLLSVGLDRNLFAYDTYSGKVIVNFTVDQPISTIDVAPDGHTVALASTRGAIYIYDLRQFKSHSKKIITHVCEIQSLCFQPSFINGITEEISSNYEVGDEVSELHGELSLDAFINTTNNKDNSEQGQQEKPLTTEEENDEHILTEEINDIFPHNIDVPACNDFDLESSTDKTRVSENCIPSCSKYSRDCEGNEDSSSTEDTEDILSCIANVDSLESHNTPAHSPGSTIADFDLHYIGREEARQTVKEIVTDLMAKKMADLCDSMSRHFVDYELAYSKQFIAQENSLREFVQQTYPAHTELQSHIQSMEEENDALRKEIEELAARNNND